jgi:general stress protein YciG
MIDSMNSNPDFRNTDQGERIAEINTSGNNNITPEVDVKIIKSRRGFAAMSPERQREIAQSGGRVAHQRGVAHKWTSEEARLAGKKGGMSSRIKGTS